MLLQTALRSQAKKGLLPTPINVPFLGQQGILFISHLEARLERAATVPNVTSLRDRMKRTQKGLSPAINTQSDPSLYSYLT